MAADRTGLRNRRAEPQIGDVLAQTPVLVIILRGEEGVVEYVSPSLSRLLKGRRLTGRPMKEAFPELAGQGWFDCVRHTYRSGKAGDCEGTVIRFATGSGAAAKEVCCTFSFEAYRDDSGQVAGVTAAGVKVGSAFVAERQAVEERRRYQSFMQNSSIGIWRFDVDEPIPLSLPPEEQVELMLERAYLAEANNAMAAMYGFDSVEPLIGTRLTDLMVRDDPQNVEYLLACVTSGYRLSGVDSHEKDNRGNDKYFRNSLVGDVRDGLVFGAWGTQQDVTGQQTVENALRRSEERLALALRASKVGIWEWNIASGQLTWSDELKAIFGLQPDDEISYEKYMELIHPDHRQELRQRFEQSLKTGEQYEVEHRLIWPDGSVHWALGRGQAILQDGKAVRMIGTSMLIDQRKQAEQQLRESEERFRNMADSAPVMIWETDADDHMTYYNSLWLRFTGVDAAGGLPDSWEQKIHHDDRQQAVRRYRQAVDARQPFSIEYRLRRHDGIYRWIIDKGQPRFSDDGSYLGYVGSCVDIHDARASQRLKAMNAALKSQRTQLLALNSSKDEFISLASHQLRTPATGVKQYIGMLLEGYCGDVTDDQLQLLHIAYESNERQLHIIDDLLKVAHIDAGKVELKKRPADLVALIRDIVTEQHDTFAKRRQKVRFEPGIPALAVDCDPDRIRMVVENLVDNAGKYSPPGKDVTVRLSESHGAVAIDIIDKGVGIAPEDADKLFQKFSRVNNPLSAVVGGTGIGLYWAKKVIDLHGGKISVASTPGKGSVFTVTLPKDST